MTLPVRMPFLLKARVELPKPEHCLRHLVDHLTEDGHQVVAQGNALVVNLQGLSGRMWCEGGYLVVEAMSDDADTAYFVKGWLDEAFRHLAEGAPVEVTWKVNWTARSLPPSFEILRVQSLQMITPRLRRVTLLCPDIARFDREDALHLQVLVNFGSLSEAEDDMEPGVPLWRRYTICSINRASDTIDLDIFLHGREGPGALWADRLRIGDLVGVAGPSGGSIGAASHYLIIGDETALPAIARMQTLLLKDAHGDVLIEVGDPYDQIPLDLPIGMRLTWFNRTSQRSAFEIAASRHLAAIDTARTFVWAGCEAETARRLRNEVKSMPQLGKGDHLITGYWRRGFA